MKIEFGSEDWGRTAYLLHRLDRETEETLYRLRSLLTEISEDPDMHLIPESYTAAEYLGNAAGRLYRLHETTAELYNILSPAQADFDDMERRFRTKIYERGVELWKIS